MWPASRASPDVAEVLLGHNLRYANAQGDPVGGMRPCFRTEEPVREGRGRHRAACTGGVRSLRLWDEAHGAPSPGPSEVHDVGQQAVSRRAKSTYQRNGPETADCPPGPGPVPRRLQWAVARGPGLALYYRNEARWVGSGSGRRTRRRPRLVSVFLGASPGVSCPIPVTP